MNDDFTRNNRQIDDNPNVKANVVENPNVIINDVDNPNVKTNDVENPNVKVQYCTECGDGIRSVNEDCDDGNT